MVAGVVLTYMRPFRIGDRVKIADTMGDIMEKTLLVTRVRTIKNVDVSIPNAMVLSSHIINFSSSAKKRGLILHTTVTIGYDVPWKKVHELLVSAAKSSENILDTPEPFILQTSLDDSYVSYELNAYTDKPNLMAKSYSELHQNIQDKFNEAGVEIMSPHYSSIRDGNQTAIPEDYLPKGYVPRPFRILPFGKFFNEKDAPEKSGL
jgi:small-conductance mechanosensitive channel